MKLLLICLFNIALISSNASTIHLCADVQDWIPYSYQSKKNNNELDGATVQLVKEIFTRLELDYKISLIPWKRCVHKTHTFKTSKRFEA